MPAQARSRLDNAIRAQLSSEQRELTAHPYADVFPLMDAESFADLKGSIAQNGQRDPILTHQGKILDGRNRYKACVELGIDPILEEWTGCGSPISLVVDRNLHRRHLTASQRNMVGARIEGMFRKEAKERQKRKPGGDFVPMNSSEQKVDSREQAAQVVGGSPSEISKAKAVLQADPELAKDVEMGKITLSQATRQVKREEKRAALDAKASRATSSTSTDPAWSIIHGDCISVMAGMQSGSARLAFADPPYNQNVNYGPHYDDAKHPDTFKLWCEEWLRELRRVLANDGTFFLVISHEVDGHPWDAILQLLAIANGFHFRQRITWYETFGQNCHRRYNRTSRAVLWFVKDRDKFVFNNEAVNRPSDRQIKYHDSRADPAGKVWDDVWQIPRLVDNSAERIPGFPTQLPLDLLRPIVGAHSDPGDLVLDPFSGSGTTGCAAIELGRRYAGIELSEEFAELSRKRLLIHSNERGAS